MGGDFLMVAIELSNFYDLTENFLQIWNVGGNFSLGAMPSLTISSSCENDLHMCIVILLMYHIHSLGDRQ